MAAKVGHPDPAVETPPLSLLQRLLGREDYRFSFFQAVRLLQHHAPDLAPIGLQGDPAKEAVRLRNHLSLAFPPSELYAVGFDPERFEEFDRHAKQPPPLDWESVRKPVEITVAFLGLFGGLGVLPYHYTELLMRRVGIGDHTLRDFLDLFNHRLLSLFYRALERRYVGVGYERTKTLERLGASAPTDMFSRYLYALIGMGTRGLQDRLGLPDDGLLFYAGLLAQRHRSAIGLEAFLSDSLGLPIRIEQFVPQTLPLSPDEQTVLGEFNCGLDSDAVLGDEVCLENAKFNVVVGPLPFRRFTTFLPPDEGRPGRAFERLVRLCRFYIGAEGVFDIKFLLAAADVPECELGATGDLAPLLGLNTWVLDRQNRPLEGILDDTVFPSELVEGPQISGVRHA